MPSHSDPCPQRYTDRAKLAGFASDLPAQLAAAYAQERTQIHTLYANQGSDTIDHLINVLVSMWTRLAMAYPLGHFNREGPEVFFRNYLADRHAWRSLLVHPSSSNPTSALETKRAVLSDAEDAVAETVSAIFRGDDRFMLNVWSNYWRNARSVRDNFPR
jgi:hypothetical protein